MSNLNIIYLTLYGFIIAEVAHSMFLDSRKEKNWIPACAGMTGRTTEMTDRTPVPLLLLFFVRMRDLDGRRGNWQ